MKSVLFFLLSVLSLVGCDNSLEWKGPVSDFSVLMNGEPWEDNPPPITNDQVLRPVKKIEGFYLYDCQDTTIEIFMVRGNYKNSIYNKEELIFHQVPFKVGKYKCIDNYPQCYQDNLTYPRFVPLLGDDVLGEIYKVLNVGDNYISIQSIDRSKEIVTGKFQVSFINVDDKKDTVHFTEGTFEVLLSEP